MVSARQAPFSLDLPHMRFRRFAPLTLGSCAAWSLFLAGAGYFFSGAVWVLVGRVQQLGVILLIALIIAVLAALGLFAVERYIIGKRVPEMAPRPLHDPSDGD
jgi:membrane protein DedA with SNARE-associated domain